MDCDAKIGVPLENAMVVDSLQNFDNILTIYIVHDSERIENYCGIVNELKPDKIR